MTRTAKTWLKAGLIALASLLGLLVLVLSLVSWLLFTRSGLDKTMSYALEHYAPCRIEVGEGKLTFFRTFPWFGVEFSDLVVYHDLETAPTDTLASLGGLSCSVNVKEFLQHRRIVVERIRLRDMTACLYTDAEGRSTLDAFAGEPDTVPTPDEPFALPERLGFSLDLKEISLNRLQALYADLPAGLEARAENFGFRLCGRVDSLLCGKATLTSSMGSLQAQLTDSTGTVTSAHARSIELKANALLNTPTVNLTDACLSFGRVEALSGPSQINLSNTSLEMAGELDLNKWIGDLTLAFLSHDIALTSEGLQAGIDNLHLLIKGRCPSADMSELWADLSGCLNDISVAMPDDTLQADITRLTLKAEGTVNPDPMDGEVSLALYGKDLRYSQGGDPLSVKADSLSLTAEARKQGARLEVSPVLYSNRLYASLGDETYLPGWPLRLSLPIATDTAFHRVALHRGRLRVKALDLSADANVDLQHDLNTDASIHVSPIAISELLAMVPQSLRSSLEDIRAEGTVSLTAKARARLPESGLDLNMAEATLDFHDVNGSVADTLHLQTERLTLGLEYPTPLYIVPDATAAVTLTSPALSARLCGQQPGAVDIQGLGINLKAADFLGDLQQMQASADLSALSLTASLDTLSAQAEGLHLNAGLNLPTDEFYDMTRGTTVDVSADFYSLMARMGAGLGLNVGNTSLSASATIDTTQEDLLLRYDPILAVDIKDASVLNYKVPVEVPRIDFVFNLGAFDIYQGLFKIGRSDLSLNGNLSNIRDYLEGNGLLTGKMDLTSQHADIDQLLSLLSGFGSESSENGNSGENGGNGSSSETTSADDTLAQGEGLDKSSDKAMAQTDSVAPDPFIVPVGVDFVLNTRIDEMDMSRHQFNNVGGQISVKDGTVVLKELGFHSSAAEMQLTAIYQTPRPDNLYAGLDFHLLDINIDQLIDLIPAIDSVVPMLGSFSGKAEFHLACETNLDGYYTPKMPTLLGAAAIQGQNLQIMDSEVFDGIKRKLLMSKKAKPVVDSLDVELQVMRNKVDLYPFVITMDRYTAALGGRHNINKDLDCRYHISILKTPLPIRLGVTVQGALNDITAHPLKRIKLTKCQYPKDYRQARNGSVDAHVLRMKRQVADALKENVMETP